MTRDFSPAVYALLAALVIALFALAGKVAWWWLIVGPLCIYCTELFWQRRRR